MSKKIKQWYDVLAPNIFNKIDIGETRALPEEIPGRTMDVLVSDLTGDARKAHIKLKLRLKGLEGEKVTTEIKGLKLLGGYLRSIVRRRSNKIMASVVVTTRDGAHVRVKPMILTAGNCKTGQEKAIRQKMIEVVQQGAKERTFDAFMLDLISEKLPKDIRNAVSPIYPVKNAEIWKADVISTPNQASTPAQAA